MPYYWKYSDSSITICPFLHDQTLPLGNWWTAVDRSGSPPTWIIIYGTKGSDRPPTKQTLGEIRLYSSIPFMRDCLLRDTFFTAPSTSGDQTLLFYSIHGSCLLTIPYYPTKIGILIWRLGHPYHNSGAKEAVLLESTQAVTNRQKLVQNRHTRPITSRKGLFRERSISFMGASHKGKYPSTTCVKETNKDGDICSTNPHIYQERGE